MGKFIKTSLSRFLSESVSNINSNFRKWFKDSKVVKDGKPVVVFHGTFDNRFDSFEHNQDKKNQLSYLGFWFAYDINVAKEFTKKVDAFFGHESVEYSETSGIKKCYLSIQNPKIYVAEDTTDQKDVIEAELQNHEMKFEQDEATLKTKYKIDEYFEIKSNINDLKKDLHISKAYIDECYAYLETCKDVGFLDEIDDAEKDIAEAERDHKNIHKSLEIAKQTFKDKFTIDHYSKYSKENDKLSAKYNKIRTHLKYKLKTIGKSDPLEILMDDRDEFAVWISGKKGVRGAWRERYVESGTIESASVALKEKLIKEGYDGIILKDTIYDSPDETPNDQYIAFYPNQIKSVDNDGSWDIDDTNINS